MRGIYKIQNRDNINTQQYWDTRCLEGRLNGGTSAIKCIVAWIKEHARVENNSKILDIGSGANKPSSFSLKMSQLYQCQCFVTDISKEICKTWDDTTIVASNDILPNLSFTEHFFDIVLCSHVLEHVDDIKGSLDEIKRITTCGGIMIINTPIGKGWQHEAEHVWWMDSGVNYEIGELIFSSSGDQYSSLIQVYKKNKINS